MSEFNLLMLMCLDTSQQIMLTLTRQKGWQDRSELTAPSEALGGPAWEHNAAAATAALPVRRVN